MKLDIVRAWKDESYRQGLTEEQRSALPANPAGELTEAEMELVYGGGGGPVGGVGAGGPVGGVGPVGGFGIGFRSRRHHHHERGGSVIGVGTSSSAASVEHVHSFGVVCDVSVFSINLVTIPIVPIASPLSQICLNCD